MRICQLFDRKPRSWALIRGFTLIMACVVMAMLAFEVVGSTSTSPFPKSSPAAQSPTDVRPLAVSSLVPDITSVTTSGAIAQKVGTTVTLVQGPTEHLRRTKVGNQKFQFDDVTLTVHGTIDGQPVYIAPVALANNTTGGPSAFRLMSASTWGTPKNAGCVDVTLTYWRYQDFIFIRSTVYKVHLGVHYCFIADHIGQDGHGNALVAKIWWFSDLVGGSEPFGPIAWQGYWDGYVGRPYDSSWRIRAQQGWHQCLIPGLGCNATEYPFIWADLRGNGTVFWDAGR